MRVANPLPNAWANEKALDGVDLVAKADLVGTPFRITALWFETNKDGVEYVYVEAEDTDLQPFTFNDSSSGVRKDVIEYLESIGKAEIRDEGTILPVSIVIPRGLRVSEFEVKDERGRLKTARTFYLTRSGVRRGDAKGTEVQPAPAKPRKATAAQ